MNKNKMVIERLETIDAESMGRVSDSEGCEARYWLQKLDVWKEHNPKLYSEIIVFLFDYYHLGGKS